MAVQIDTTTSRFVGLSTDEKPVTAVPAGSLFTETDTGRWYTFDGFAWQPQPVAGIADDETARLLTALVTIVGRIEQLLILATDIDVRGETGVGQ